MTSRADDFGVRYDDGDADGWDTQGFRRAEDHDYGPPTEAFTPEPDYGGSGPVRPSYDTQRIASPQQDYGQQTNGYSPVSGYRTQQFVDVVDVPGRRGARHGRGAGPDGPGGPRGPRGPRVKIKGSWWRRWSIRKALGVLASLFGVFIITVALVVVYVYNKTPVPDASMAALRDQPSMVYTSDGKFIGRFGDENHQNVNYAQIPQKIIDSVLAAEDRSFFSEGGVSPTGILRAAYEDTIGGGNFQGGSTITQQFVRNYYQGIGTQQTASRKIKEIFVAMKIARSKSKTWILENYLNTIYLGEGANGIGAAARTYFKIPVSRLSTISWAQAAMLAAIIQQPSTYPLKQYRPQLINRWHYVLGGLVTMGSLTQAQAAALKFPSFGEYNPPSYGTDVWDPYVLDVAKNELMGVFHYTPQQLDNGGYKITTTISAAKMTALYAAVQTQENQMVAGGEGLQSYMHVGAVLEDPHTSAIEAMYAGPGYPGAKYNGVGHVISQKECDKIHCEVNMAVYNREQVGSSFKPMILATAVSQGMNVQSSMLDGQNSVCIPPDSSMMPSMQNAYPVPAANQAGCPTNGSYFYMPNDSPAENGAYNPQDAMTFSVNTAYADLWHYVGGANVLHMASMFGVNTASFPAGSGLIDMQHEAGVALGQASLTVGEQATFLSAIANNGTYNQIHIIKGVQQGGQNYPLHLDSHPVFNGNTTVNQNMASQVQYAMQKVVYQPGATAYGNGMSDGRQIISKTGTTNNAQSAFFIGAIPQESLAVAIFTNHQGTKNDTQTLNGLGGIAQNFGGVWPAAIWHTYAQDQFMQIQPQTFPAPVFTGDKLILAPKNLIGAKKHKQHKQHDKHQPPAGSVPTPTATCPPSQATVDCNVVPPSAGASPSPSPMASSGFGPAFGTSGGIATPVGATAGAVALLPASLFWYRRLERKKSARRVK